MQAVVETTEADVRDQLRPPGRWATMFSPPGTDVTPRTLWWSLKQTEIPQLHADRWLNVSDALTESSGVLNT